MLGNWLINPKTPGGDQICWLLEIYDYVSQNVDIDGETGVLGVGVHCEAKALGVHCNRKSFKMSGPSKNQSQILNLK